MDPHAIFPWISKNSLLTTTAISEVYLTAMGLLRTTTSSVNEHSTIWLNWPNYWAELGVLICTAPLTVCSSCIMYTLQSESTFYIFLNVNELPAQNRRDIWSLSNCNGTLTHNHLLRQQTLTHLAKLTKWLTWVASTYLYGAINCMFLSYHVRVSEWIHTLYLPDGQGTPWIKQAQYLKFKSLQRDSNVQPLRS